MGEKVQCAATKPLLTTTKRCPRWARYGEWCQQHAQSVGGWRLVPPGAIGVLLSAEQTNILRDHLDSRSQTPSEFFGDVLMEYGLGRATGKEYPPARPAWAPGWRAAFEAGWMARARRLEHIGSPVGYASEPVNPLFSHDGSCCAARGCHPVCSHLCGTDLHICDGTEHPAARLHETEPS